MCDIPRPALERLRAQDLEKDYVRKIYSNI